MTKEKYVRPIVKSVKWESQKAICSAVYTSSPCIHIVDETGGTTRIDHRSSTAAGGIQWNNWPGTSN